MSTVFGGGGDSGATGWGEERTRERYDVNKEAFTDRGKLEEDRQRMLAEYEAAQNRAAPTAAQTANVQGAALGPATGVSAPTVGQVAAGPATRVGQVSGPAAAAIDQSQQQQFRGGQSTLASQLADQAAGRGPSLAEAQARASLRQSLANRVAAAATARPTGTAAATQRALSQEAAVAEANTIGQAAQARIAEQLAAREQLNTVLSTGRSTDVDFAKAQAALQQEAALKGTDVALQRSLSQADISSREGLAAFQAERDRASQQAQLDFEAGRITAEQLNQFKLQQAAFQQQAMLANQQTALSTNLADQEAQLRTMGLNDAQIQAMLGGSAQLTQQQYDDAMAYEQLNAEQAMQYEQMRLNSENAAAERRSSGVGQVIGAVGAAIGGAAMMSDPRTKENVEEYDSSRFAEALREASKEVKAPEKKPAKSGGLLSDPKTKTDITKADDKKTYELLASTFGKVGSGFQEGAANSRASRQEPIRRLQPTLSPGFAKTNIARVDASDLLSNPASNAANQVTAPTVGIRPGSISAGLYQPAASPGTSLAGPGLLTPANTSQNQTQVQQQTTRTMLDPGQAAISDRHFDYTGTATGGGFGSGRVAAAGDTVVSGRPAIAPSFLEVTTQQQVPVKAPVSIAPSNPFSAYFNNGSNLANDPAYGFAGEKPAKSVKPVPTTWESPLLSDRSTKEQVDEAVDDKLKGFMDALTAYEYEYKPEYKDKPGAAPGRHVSVMADDLEKTSLGKEMVSEGPDGLKRVDYGRGFGVMLAAEASLNERLSKVEQKLGKKGGKR